MFLKLKPSMTPTWLFLEYQIEMVGIFLRKRLDSEVFNNLNHTLGDLHAKEIANLALVMMSKSPNIVIPHRL